MTHRLLALFVIPGVWLAFFGLAAALHKTSWGQEGHPSNSVILLIYVLLGAPFFGAAGCAYAMWRKTRYPKRLHLSAVAVNVAVMGIGVWFWLSMWL